MRSVAAIVLILWVAFATPGPAGVTQTFDAAHRTAMASYYAALLASDESDSEATLRRVLVLKAKWETVARASQSDGPAWARDVTTGQSPVAAVAALIDDIHQRTTSRDTGSVHADLEGIRVLLRDARARHGVRIRDDALTDYHDTMERLTSRVGLRNEIILNSEDYGAIRDLADRTQAFWEELETLAGPFEMLPGWQDAVAGTRHDLATLQTSAAEEDAQATQAAGVELKEHYHQLLRILSRG